MSKLANLSHGLEVIAEQVQVTTDKRAERTRDSMARSWPLRTNERESVVTSVPPLSSSAHDQYAVMTADLDHHAVDAAEKLDPFFAQKQPKKLVEARQRLRRSKRNLQQPAATLPYGISDVVALAMCQKGDGLLRLLQEEQRKRSWHRSLAIATAGITTTAIAALYMLLT